MEYKYLTRTLMDFIPELKAAYDEEMAWLEEDLPHVMFGLVFNPLLEKSLRNDRNSQVVQTLFEFIEQMARSNDGKVQEVLVVTVLESLVPKRDIVDVAWTHMGSSTKELFTHLERECGWVVERNLDTH